METRHQSLRDDEREAAMGVRAESSRLGQLAGSNTDVRGLRSDLSSLSLALCSTDARRSVLWLCRDNGQTSLLTMSPDNCGSQLRSPDSERRG